MKIKNYLILLLIVFFIFPIILYPKNILNLYKIATIPEYAPDDLFGNPVRNIGDINNDGFDDLAIGYGQKVLLLKYTARYFFLEEDEL